MTSQFSNEVLKVCVGQVCQAIGYQGIYNTPLEVLTDLLHRYLTELCRLAHRYTEHFGRTEPTLDDLGLAFMDMGISVAELEDYINNVDCPPFPHPMPQVPVPRPSNLNFLKPGAREILSRPIHIHEHLPPMYPEKEEEEVEVKVGGGLDDAVGEGSSPTISPQPAVNRPADSEASPAKKPKFSLDDEGQPVREIVSVMMTTSGFISSAREGKLPEARCPDIPLALPRSSSPNTVGKKKLTVEKLIRQKNSQVLGGGLPRSGPLRPPRPKIKTGGKDRLNGKGLKLPKFPSRPISLPKGGPPGSSPMPPKLKMPLLKPPAPKPIKVTSPKGPIPPKAPATPKASPPKTGPSPGLPTPKPTTPKIKVPKPQRPPKVEGKKSGVGQVKTEKGDKEKDKDKEGEPVNVSKKVKKEKDGSKKEGKKEGSKKEGKKEGKKEARKDKEGRKEGSKKETKKEKEMKKERERERELIIALQSSSAVTVTSIPAPSKPPDVLPPPGPEKAEGKSKLSIFKKINKTKDAKEEREAPSLPPGPTPTSGLAQPSRDSSPDLMIDETPGRGHRRLPEELPPEMPPVEAVLEEPGPRSPADYTSFQDDLSPPATPSTPRTPELPAHLPPHRPPEKKRAREKGRERRPRKDRSKSPKGGPFSPGPREAGEPESPDRPKTPEAGLPMEDMGGPPGAPFLPAFPTAPGFIPPFSRFPFLHPFGGPPPRPGMAPPIPDLRLPPHHPFLPRPPLKRPLEDDPLCPVEDNEPLERPPTPRHPREGSPLMVRGGHGSPMRSPSPSTPPRPRTPAHHSPPPQAPPRPHPRPEKPEKPDKEKKKEHKKEKKEKEKEKEKGKKKKDKKDKEKEKDKAEKKKEKEKTKQEKKEKKVKREKEDGGGSPRITMKLASSLSNPDGPLPTTPKLVIKPVVKHDDNPPPPPPPPSSTQDDQPGSPEIAKISALITRPPRSSQQKRAESPQALPVLKIKDVPNPASKHKEGKESGHTPAKVKEVPPLKIKNPTTTSNKGASSKASPPTPKQPVTKLPTSPKASMATGPKVPPMPKVIEEKKSLGVKKTKEKKEKKEKKMKDIPPPTPNPLVGSISKPGPSAGGGASETPYPSHSPMPIVSPPLESPKPSKKQEQKSTGLLTETVGPIGHFVDDQGNEVWICPTCGKQDDGSPMIGCDTCDDWYHWVCVGIQVPPNADVNWYCRRCLSQHKQRGAPPEKKKRGRKKK